MIYNGRAIDPVSLWSAYIDFPSNMRMDGQFSDLTVCPNPAHNTFKKHFQVNLRKPLVHCFASCGISGTYEKAISIIEGVDVAEARSIILRASRLSLTGEASAIQGAREHPPELREESVDDLAAFKNGGFQWLPLRARTYLDSRSIDASARAKWQIGWDDEAERVVLPAFDERGTLRFLIRRSIDFRRPKYLYSHGFSKSSCLWGACYLNRDQVESNGLILVEGSFDAIRLHQMGYANAVAILGTGLSQKQRTIIDRIGPKKIYFMFDRDLAGAENIIKGHYMLQKYPIRVCLYPGERADPAELKRKEVDRVIERAIPAATFFSRSGIVSRRRNKFEISKYSSRS